MISNLLKIITGRHEVDGRFEEEATRFLGGLVGTTARGEGSDVVPCLTMQAVLAWTQNLPQLKGMFVRFGVVPAVFTALQASLPRACCDEVAMHTVSAAAKVILFYLRDSHLDMILEDIEQCDGVRILLEACRAQGSCSRSVCIGLHVLKHMTKHSPRLLRRAMELDGPGIICSILRENKDADIIKFGALTLSRWAASPGTQDRLLASGAYEHLWEILRTKEKYESSVYAYVMLAICLMMGGRIEEVWDSFLERPQDFIRFCRGVDHHDASFGEQGVVHHTLGLLVSSSKSFDLIIEATRNDVIGVLAKSSVRCGYILDVLYQNREQIQAIHDIQVRLKLAVFLVEKMAMYPDASLGVLFYRKEDALIETLVAHSFEHLMVANMRRSDDESPQSDDDDEKMHLTKFSWESQSIVFDSPGGYYVNSAKNDDSLLDGYSCSHQLEEEQHTEEEKAQLGHACFEAFASQNSVLGSLILLCKISLKMRQRKASNENLVSGRKRRCFSDTTAWQKKARTSHPTPQSSTGHIRRFIVEGQEFKIEERSICAMSHVLASMCEDAEYDEQIHVPCLHHLSTADMILSFERILEWCQTGDLQDLNTLEEIQTCWIVADYLGMPSLERHLGEQIRNLVGSPHPSCDRTDVFAMLQALHNAHYGSNTLESTIAECIVTELGTCGPGGDTIPNWEFLQDFVLHPPIADRVAEVFQKTLIASDA